MLHIHFGAGRLGLGLVAPFFRKPGSELRILNRAGTGSKATGSTGLPSCRRNELLENHSDRTYVIQSPGENPADTTADRETVHYDGFATYDDASIKTEVSAILERTTAQQAGVIVIGTVLTIENYAAVLQALQVLAEAREAGAIGPLFLVACEIR